MKKLILTILIAAVHVVPALADDSRVYHGEGHGSGYGGFCSYVASKFQQDLRACWRSNSSGCVRFYTRKDVMSDRDFHTCKYDLYTTCVSTCASVWGANDTGCNNSCAIIGKYLN